PGIAFHVPVEVNEIQQKGQNNLPVPEKAVSFAAFEGRVRRLGIQRKWTQFSVGIRDFWKGGEEEMKTVATRIRDLIHEHTAYAYSETRVERFPCNGGGTLMFDHQKRQVTVQLEHSIIHPPYRGTSIPAKWSEFITQRWTWDTDTESLVRKNKAEKKASSVSSASSGLTSLGSSSSSDLTSLYSSDTSTRPNNRNNVKGHHPSTQYMDDNTDAIDLAVRNHSNRALPVNNDDQEEEDDWMPEGRTFIASAVSREGVQEPTCCISCNKSWDIVSPARRIYPSAAGPKGSLMSRCEGCHSERMTSRKEKILVNKEEIDDLPPLSSNAVSWEQFQDNVHRLGQQPDQIRFSAVISDLWDGGNEEIHDVGSQIMTIIFQWTGYKFISKKNPLTTTIKLICTQREPQRKATQSHQLNGLTAENDSQVDTFPCRGAGRITFDFRSCRASIPTKWTQYILERQTWNPNRLWNDIVKENKQRGGGSPLVQQSFFEDQYTPTTTTYTGGRRQSLSRLHTK
ncbi:440_t:CDS:2, partial [Acaulospora colombiana]